MRPFSFTGFAAIAALCVSACATTRTADTQTAAPENPDDPVICRTEQGSGTRIRFRTCLPESEWAKIDEEADQTARGPLEYPTRGLPQDQRVPW